MKKILTMLLAVVVLSSMAMAQTPKELNGIRKASCQIRVGAEFAEVKREVEVNGKKIILKHTPRWGSAGSGTIVGRTLTKDKSKPKWVYWIMTAKHCFPPNFKKAVKKALWIHFYGHNGAKDVMIWGASKFWINPGSEDVAFLGFYSSEDLPMIPLAKLPENLFGVRFIGVGHPFVLTPFIRAGFFTTNAPTPNHKADRVGTSCAFAPGMSGGGVFIMQDGKLRAAGIITSWIGNTRTPDRFGCVTRIDHILKALAKFKMSHMVEQK